MEFTKSHPTIFTKNLYAEPSFVLTITHGTSSSPPTGHHSGENWAHSTPHVAQPPSSNWALSTPYIGLGENPVEKGSPPAKPCPEPLGDGLPQPYAVFIHPSRS